MVSSIARMTSYLPVARTRPLSPGGSTNTIRNCWMSPALRMPPFTPCGTPLPQDAWNPESTLSQYQRSSVMPIAVSPQTHILTFFPSIIRKKSRRFHHYFRYENEHRVCSFSVLVSFQKFASNLRSGFVPTSSKSQATSIIPALIGANQE